MMTPILAQIANGPRGPATTILTVAMLALAALGLVVTLLMAKYFNLWIQARMSGAPVSLTELVAMSFRKVDAKTIVRAKIMAMQGGLTEKDGVTIRSLEAHQLAGGDVTNVVGELIASRRVGIPLTFEQAAAIDFAGRDPKRRPTYDTIGDIDALITEQRIHHDPLDDRFDSL